MVAIDRQSIKREIYVKFFSRCGYNHITARTKYRGSAIQQTFKNIPLMDKQFLIWEKAKSQNYTNN